MRDITNQDVRNYIEGNANHLLDKIGMLPEEVKIIRLPGLIDMHVHLREPGATHKESLALINWYFFKGSCPYHVFYCQHYFLASSYSECGN